MLADAALDCIPSAEISTAVTVTRAACELARRADPELQAFPMSMLPHTRPARRNGD